MKLRVELRGFRCLAFLFCLVVWVIPSTSQESSKSLQPDPHQRFLPKTLDERLIARAIELIDQGKIEEFIGLARLFSSKGIEEKKITPLFFHSVASSDDVYLLILAKEGLLNINASDEAGNSAFASIFSVPEVTGRERLARLELLLDLKYNIREDEFLVLSAGYNAVEFFNYADSLEGFDFNADIVYSGTTPLIAAIKFGSLEAVKALLARGADPKFKDDYGKSAIDYTDKEWPESNISHLSLNRILERQNLIREAVRKR